MSDLISRQAAIDALEGEIEVVGKANAEAVLKYTKMVCNRIKALPSVQQNYDLSGYSDRLWKAAYERGKAEAEVKHGEWIMHIDDLFPAESTMECSKCHHEQSLIIDDNFCPYCGAKMRKETEDA